MPGKFDELGEIEGHSGVTAELALESLPAGLTTMRPADYQPRSRQSPT